MSPEKRRHFYDLSSEKLHLRWILEFRCTVRLENTSYFSLISNLFIACVCPPTNLKYRSTNVNTNYHKFTVVYCESLNLIGYITADYLLFYNKLSSARNLIGSQPWSIEEQTHRWRQHSIQIWLLHDSLNQSQFFAKHCNHSVRFIWNIQ